MLLIMATFLLSTFTVLCISLAVETAPVNDNIVNATVYLQE